MQMNQIVASNPGTATVARGPRRATCRYRMLALLGVILPGLLALPVSAQSPQPGTPPAPAVPGENAPRAEGPAQAAPAPEATEEEEDEGGEGCPYLGTPLELVV